MSRKLVAWLLLVPFSILTLYVLYDVGLIEIFDYHRRSSAGWQVFTDLVIALILVLLWLVPDAKANGRNPWPWVVATLCTGSIGPLLYLATEPSKGKEST